VQILFLTADLPYPPYAGAPLRIFGLIEGLAEHAIWLMSFTIARVDPAQTPLGRLCRRVITVPAPLRSTRDRLRGLALSHQPDMAFRRYSPRYAQELRQLLQQQAFDLIQIENLEMAVYLPVIREVQPDTPIVYDAHNAEYALQRRIYESDRSSTARLHVALYSYIQSQRLRRFERQVCQDVNYVVAVSDTDADLLRALDIRTPVAVVPNGISTRLYRPADEPIDLGDAALVFTGKMDFRPNVDAALWFAEEILPLVRQDVPNAHFYVVGQSPHPRLDVLRGQPGITLTGLVPDIVPYLHAASVFVVPLRMGSGTRLKVLEAMAAARPIISTQVGVQGLNVTDGQEVILADTSREFAQAVVELQKNRERAAAMGRRAEEFVRQYYDWSVLLPRLMQVYGELGVL
jgi:glycosyltransferase involved in cell wall biosynthesis